MPNKKWHQLNGIRNAAGCTDTISNADRNSAVNEINTASETGCRTLHMERQQLNGIRQMQMLRLENEILGIDHGMHGFFLRGEEGGLRSRLIAKSAWMRLRV